MSDWLYSLTLFSTSTVFFITQTWSLFKTLGHTNVKKQLSDVRNLHMRIEESHEAEKSLIESVKNASNDSQCLGCAVLIHSKYDAMQTDPGLI